MAKVYPDKWGNSVIQRPSLRPERVERRLCVSWPPVTPPSSTPLYHAFKHGVICSLHACTYAFQSYYSRHHHHHILNTLLPTLYHASIAAPQHGFNKNPQTLLSLLRSHTPPPRLHSVLSRLPPLTRIRCRSSPTPSTMPINTEFPFTLCCGRTGLQSFMSYFKITYILLTLYFTPVLKLLTLPSDINCLKKKKKSIYETVFIKYFHLFLYMLCERWWPWLEDYRVQDSTRIQTENPVSSLANRKITPPIPAVIVKCTVMIDLKSTKPW